MDRAARRAEVCQQIVQRAREDRRIVSAAQVGSLTTEHADEWSDLDLTFGVAGDTIDEVVADFTSWLEHAFGAVVLFDLPAGGTLYRVHLLPGPLQVDLSFSPGGRVTKGSPRFAQLFGEHVVIDPTPVDVAGMAGWAVHHCLFIRVCIERGKLWQAIHNLSELRDLTLSLHCARAGLPARYGRGFDQLPRQLLDRFEATLPASSEPAELRRAHAAAIAELLRVEGVPLIAAVQAQLESWADPTAPA